MNFNRIWQVTGILVGLTSLSICLGSVPKPGHVTDDTAIYQRLSDLRVQKQADLNFDGDIARLSAIENRYHDRLPELADSLQKPMRRIAERRYRAAPTKVRQTAQPN